MTKDKAVQTFLDGYNCAQSVVSAFSEDMGLQKEHALKLAAGLGAGLNYQGKTCGAVLGAYIILGLRYGTDISNNQEGKLKLRKILDQFSKEFKAEYSSLECREILGLDVSKEEELEQLRKKNAFEEICPVVVETASKVLEKILKESEY